MGKSMEVDKISDERKEAEDNLPDRSGRRITVVEREISSEASVSEKAIADREEAAAFGSPEGTGGH